MAELEESIVEGILRSAADHELPRLSTLSRVSQCLSLFQENPSLLEELLRLLVPGFKADRGHIRLLNPSGLPTLERYLEGASTEKFLFTSTLLDECLRTREPLIMPDSMEEVGSHSIQTAGIRSVMLAPLLQHGRVLGVFYLDSVHHIAPFEENDLKLLKVVGDMVAVAVDRNNKAQVVTRQSEELAEAQRLAEVAAEETITKLSRAAEYRDGETSEHLVRVSLYCEALARKLGMEEQEVHQLKIASLLHDVGKLGIPDNVMLKPGRFTQYERQLMQKHTVFGGRILADSNSRIVQLAAEIALGHHEKWDGSGYPLGIAGEDIPLSARIVAIADVFDAVSSARRYKASYSISESFQMIEEGAGSHFDPNVSEAFLQISARIEKIWENNQTPEKAAEPVVEEPKQEVVPRVAERNGDAPCLWVLDSDPFQRERLSTEAVRRGYRVLESSCGLELTERLATEKPDAGIVEIADEGAATLIQKLLEHDRKRPLAVFSRDGSLTRRLSVVGLENCSYLHKPLPPDAVLDELELLLVHQERKTAKTVLALDDDPVVLKVISRLLEKQGIRVFTASEATGFWKLLTKHAPDLILLDLELPLVDGFQVCRLLRADVNYRHLPIVVLTAHHEAKEYRRALEAGADDVLEKPLNQRRLFSRIQTRLSRNLALRLAGVRDPVTGLLEKSVALRIMEALLLSTLRQEQPFTLARLRIPQFDKLGQEKGFRERAKLLGQVSELIQNSNRPEDVLTRLDGFTLLIALSGLDQVGFEQRLAGWNSKLNNVRGPVSSLTCEGSSATAPGDGTELSSLLATLKAE